MNRHPHLKRLTLLSAMVLMAVLLALSAAAMAWSVREAPAPYVAGFTKNGLISEGITFTADDFYVQNAGKLKLISVTLNTIPSPEVGHLCVGSEVLECGAVIEQSALSGLRFRPLEDPVDVTTKFSFTPSFSDGTAGPEAIVTLYLLDCANGAPVAEKLSLSTYRDVPITGYFSAVDPEGGTLTFQLTDRPARGAVSYEEGSSTFVYTPYEGKTGKDSFSYVAIDEVGNVSEPAKVTVKIQKPATKVSYSDLDDSTAGAAAIRLAERGIFTGECMGSQYFFRPEKAVSRSEFITMAMSAAGMEPLSGISMTGFSDDLSIPTWAKGYVSSALKAGLVRGMANENGQLVFNPDAAITRAEATVLLDRMMNVTDVTTDVFYSDRDAAPAWAYQSAVNLETAGILRTVSGGALSLNSTINRGEAAEMLCAAMDILDARK